MLDFAPPPQERVGHRSYPRLTFRGRSGLALAMRLCRDGDTSLAQLLRRVPAEYVGAAVRLADRHPVQVVGCVCGAAQEATDGLRACSGGCGRHFIADDGGVWAFRLPPQES
jgi:hypothetical protein